MLTGDIFGDFPSERCPFVRTPDSFFCPARVPVATFADRLLRFFRNVVGVLTFAVRLTGAPHPRFLLCGVGVLRKNTRVLHFFRETFLVPGTHVGGPPTVFFTHACWGPHFRSCLAEVHNPGCYVRGSPPVTFRPSATLVLRWFGVLQNRTRVLKTQNSRVL